MIEIRIPKEITKYKERLFFNLTLRQTICTVIAVGINVPLYFFGKKYVDEDIISWIVIAIAVPIMLTGYFNYNGMTFEKFVTVLFKANFVYPQIRVYENQNPYEIINNKIRRNTKHAKTLCQKEKRRKKSNSQVLPKDYSL